MKSRLLLLSTVMFIILIFSVYAQNNVPTHDTPTITPTSPTINQNLTCNWNNITDLDGDSTHNITVWYKNEKPFVSLYMPFEGVNGNEDDNVTDYSGNNYNGSVVDAVWNESIGLIGGAYMFDGNDDYIFMLSMESIDLTSHFTVLAWVNGTYGSDQGTIFDSGFTSNNYWSFQVDTSRELRIREDGGSTTGGSIQLNNSQWHHVAIVKDGDTGTNIQFYVDGNLDPTGGSIGTADSDGIPSIGSRREAATVSDSMNGIIDELKVYNFSLTADQIYEEYIAGLQRKAVNILSFEETSLNDNWICSVTPNDGIEDGVTKNSSSVTIINNNVPTHDTPTITPTSPTINQNLTCNWNNVTDLNGHDVTNITNWYKNGKSITSLNLPFEGVNGNEANNAKDYSGFERNATVGGASYNSIGGIVGGAYEFDGSNDFIDLIASNQIITDDTSWTQMLWFKSNFPALISTAGDIMKFRRAATGSATMITINDASDDLEFVYHDGSSFNLNTMDSLVTLGNDWHHVAATYDGTTYKVYLNGIPNGTYVDTFSGYGTGVAILGYNKDATNQYFNGSIDEVKIFNITLSAAQILNIYEEESIGKNFQTLISDETSLNDEWFCSVTPNDGIEDGITKNSTSITVGDLTAPSDIINFLNVSQNNQSVNLNWTNPSNIDYNHSELYYNITGGGLIFVANISNPTNEYNVTSLINGTIYTFQIRPVDHLDNKGNYTLLTTTTYQNPANPTLILNTDLVNNTINYNVESLNYTYNGTFINIEPALATCDFYEQGILNRTLTNVNLSQNNLYNITFGAFVGQYNISFNCSNANVNASSGLFTYTIDTINPIILSDFDNNTRFNLSETVRIYFNISDDNLFAYNFTLSNSTNPEIENVFVENLTITFAENLTTRTLTAGNYSWEVQAWDSHTTKSIEPYKIDDLGNGLKFEDSIKIHGKDILSSSTEKKEDRYQFSFEFKQTINNIKTFYIESNNQLIYLPNSGYKLHFVDLINKKWIDFESFDYTQYTVTQINSTKYEIKIKVPAQAIIFDSIGDLNTKTLGYDFEVYLDLPPGDITNFLNISQNNESVNLNWTNPIESDYNHSQLYYNISGGGLTFVVNISNTTSPNNEYNVTGLTNATIYTFQIRPVDDRGTPGNYTTVTTTTYQNPELSPPDIITNFLNVSQNNQSVFLNWTNPTNYDYNHSELYYNVSGGALTFVVNISNATDPNNEYNVTSLTNGTTYTFQIRTVDHQDHKSDFVTLTTTTYQNPTDTTAPSILSVINFSITNFTFAINVTLNETGNATAYVSTSSDLSSPTIVNSSVFSLNHTLLIEGLTNGTLYFWQVNGSDSNGNYYNSNIFNVTTAQTTPPPIGGGSPPVGGGGGGQPGPSCGNNICEAGENIDSCAVDCLIEPDDAPLISDIDVNRVWFSVFTEKYSYELTEDIPITVKTYFNNKSQDADTVSLEIKQDELEFGTFRLQKSAEGIYLFTFPNILDEGNYDFEFKVKKDDFQINDTYKINVANNPSLLNEVFEANRKLSTASAIIISTLIISITAGLGFVFIRRRKK